MRQACQFIFLCLQNGTASQEVRAKSGVRKSIGFGGDGVASSELARQ
jgi:hypothetical protein